MIREINVKSSELMGKYLEIDGDGSDRDVIMIKVIDSKSGKYNVGELIITPNLSTYYSHKIRGVDKVDEGGISGDIEL